MILTHPKYSFATETTTYFDKPYNVIDNVRIYGIWESIKASGYPMAKDAFDNNANEGPTQSDMDRAKRLAAQPSNSGHPCFLKGITVQMDLSFTEKAWPEAQRYHWFDIISSMSTMHMLPKMELKYVKYTDWEIIERFREIVEEYNACKSKESWLHMIYSYPSGLILTARITTNYLQLKNIYSQRRNHRLPEWQEFCDWVETLPYSFLITGKDEHKQTIQEVD